MPITYGALVASMPAILALVAYLVGIDRFRSKTLLRVKRLERRVNRLYNERDEVDDLDGEEEA